MTRNTIPKYRPSLTADQIVHLISLLRKDSSQESLLIIGVLAQFEFKIKQNAITPAYQKDVKNPLSVDLGFSLPKQDVEISPKEMYQLWKEQPASLSVKELIAVRTYRYENDLMNPEEEKQYEAEILGIPILGA